MTRLRYAGVITLMSFAVAGSGGWYRNTASSGVRGSEEADVRFVEDDRKRGGVVAWPENSAAELAVLANLFDESEQHDWQERALCAQTDPEAFFPEKGGSTREAKRICQGCEVKDECLEYALEHDERFGIWGGLSERERRKLKRRAS